MMPEKEERLPAPPYILIVEVCPGHSSTMLHRQFPDGARTIHVELTAPGIAHLDGDLLPMDALPARFFVRAYLQQNGLPFSVGIHSLSTTDTLPSLFLSPLPDCEA